LTKEIIPDARFADGFIGRLSLHRHDAGCVTFKFGVHPTTHSSMSFMDVAPRRLSTWSAPRASTIMLDGLIMKRMICKARPCEKLTGMIDADLVPISHVSGSHQLGRTFHEVIIFTVIVTRQRRGGAMCSACTEPVVRSDG